MKQRSTLHRSEKLWLEPSKPASHRKAMDSLSLRGPYGYVFTLLYSFFFFFYK
ncbi:hypothetical protein DEO72_LG2g2650 [Vigna unguiculata]|uniref:Uncharacterized protein n=1 Tax=Vigna unguiculata TaxID=3917 RepID=A0A4D6L1H4_VIGUN|nr:hypothetical protein DEO72_LG2g2650 [Vigna unguiculata]